MRITKFIWGAVLWSHVGWLAAAAELTLKVTEKAPPKELDPAIAQLLQPRAVQLLDGNNPIYEFWLRAELPLSSKPASPAKALDAIKETTLLGAVAVARAQRDYRDDELAAGVYTMRFSFQPEDGDHLGTAEYRYFAVLTPAKTDTKPDALNTYRALVKASGKETSSNHPVILSLRPPSAEGGETPKLEAPAPEHKSVRVQLPATAGGEKTSIPLEIVYEGHGKK